MRIFVSSSFEDLKEHRACAIRILRQLGHEVIAMEDMTAGSLAPLVHRFDENDHIGPVPAICDDAYSRRSIRFELQNR